MTLPLGEPLAAPLGDEERERYSRTILLPEFGEEGQRRLRSARVLLVGAGGLGAPVALGLACAGIGTLGVIDADRVDLGNLQRQFAHRLRDVGRRKTRSAARAVHALNPDVVVRTHPFRLTADNAAELFADYDIVVDGSDNFATRYLVADAAGARGIPTVWGSVLRFEGQVSVFWPGHGPGYRDLYPDANADGPTCGTAGVLGALCAQVGAIMTGEVVKLAAGVGEPLVGRVMVIDALRAQSRTFALAAAGDPGRAAGAAGADASAQYASACGAATVACSADASPHAAAAAPARPGVITASALRAELAAADGDAADGSQAPVLVDVREPHEPGGIPGAVRVPLSRLRGAEDLIPPGPLVVYCAAGVRSETAAALLTAQGRPARSLAGGLAAWEREPAATP